MGRRRHARGRAARPDGRRGERRDARARLGRPRGRGQGAGPARRALSGARARRAAAPPPARRGAREPRAPRPRPRAEASRPRDERRALRAAARQGPLRRAHVHPPPHAPRRGRDEAPRRARAAPEVRRRHAGALLGPAGRPRGERGARVAPVVHARGPRLPFSRLPAPGGRDAVVASQARHVGGRARALPPAHDEGAGAARKGAEPHREAGPRGLLPDRLGHRELLQEREHPRAGARLGREQRRLLRALDHGGRPGPDGAPLRAFPLGGARRVARHRPRPPLRGSAGEGHPARLLDVRRARRRDDGERHHVPRPLGRARDGEGRRLRAGPGRHAREAPRALQPSASTATARATFPRRWPPRASTLSRRA